MKPATKLQNLPTVPMIRAYRRYMDSTPRTMSVSAQEKHNAQYRKLEAQCKERGLTINDLDDWKLHTMACGRVILLAA